MSIVQPALDSPVLTANNYSSTPFVTNSLDGKTNNSFTTGGVADGYYHPEDEVFMPWFMRLSPSTSQAVQVGTGGRYTLMGSLNPYPGFKMPATGC